MLACSDKPLDETTEADLDRCVLGESGCPSGCVDIISRPYDPASGATCLGDFEVIGCYPAGTDITDDARCAKSPAGLLASVSGSYSRQLIRREGFSSCSDDERAARRALAACAQ